MQVDLSPWGLQDEASRQYVLCDRIAEPLYVLDQFSHMSQFDHEVDVVMSPVLFAQERIHTPASVEPDADAGRTEPLEQSQHIFGSHHRPDDAQRVSSAFGSDS
jgi:hypothetical protein